MVRFLLFFAILAMFSCSNSGLTKEDKEYLSHRDSVLMANFDSIVEGIVDSRFEMAGIELNELDSLAYPIAHADAGATYKRILALRKAFTAFKGSSLDKDGKCLQFPKGALEDTFYQSSNGLKYRMISMPTEERGIFWSHFSIIHPTDTCLAYILQVDLDIDAEGNGISGYAWMEGRNECSGAWFDPTVYFDGCARQAVTEHNWILGEFETIAKEISS